MDKENTAGTIIFEDNPNPVINVGGLTDIKKEVQIITRVEQSLPTTGENTISSLHFTIVGGLCMMIAFWGVVRNLKNKDGSVAKF